MSPWPSCDRKSETTRLEGRRRLIPAKLFRICSSDRAPCDETRSVRLRTNRRSAKRRLERSLARQSPRIGRIQRSLPDRRDLCKRHDIFIQSGATLSTWNAARNLSLYFLLNSATWSSVQLANPAPLFIPILPSLTRSVMHFAGVVAFDNEG